MELREILGCVGRYSLLNEVREWSVVEDGERLWCVIFLWLDNVFNGKAVWEFLAGNIGTGET